MSPVDGEKSYSFLDFTLALKVLPEPIATAAFAEFMYAFSMGKDKQPIYRKYVEWSKTPSWARKPWEKHQWEK